MGQKSQMPSIKFLHEEFGNRGNVEAGIDYVQRNVILDRPIAPAKPILKQNHTVEDVSEYGVKLAEYTGKLVEYENEKASVKRYNQQVGKSLEQFVIKYSQIYEVVPKHVADVLVKHFKEESGDELEILCRYLNALASTFENENQKVGLIVVDGEYSTNK